MNSYERVALEQYLTFFNKDWEYQQVLDAIASGDEDNIKVWEPFENWEGREIVDLIDTLRDVLTRTFKVRC